mmetsp:Transcript_19395/g.41770  ORF Transcript_19395/g.41770 Transcript_19395/m.41770 type:complete len:136 (+) Transcript_19395:838-1245(+)
MLERPRSCWQSEMANLILPYSWLKRAMPIQALQTIMEIPHSTLQATTQAAVSGRLSIAKFLVEEHQANVNASNDKGDTPLHISSKKGHLSFVKYLVEEAHSDVHVTNNDGHIPLALASEHGQIDTVRFLVEHTLL